MSLDTLLGESPNLETEVANAEGEAPEVEQTSGGAEGERAAQETQTQTPAEKKHYDSKLDAEVIERGGERVVSVHALQQSRIKQREATDALVRVEAEQGARLKLLQDRLDQLAAAKNVPPAFEADPAGNLHARLTQAESALAENNKTRAETARANEQSRAEQELAGHLVASEQAYAKVKPDYLQAAQYLADTIDCNLQVFGVDNPVERNAIRRQQVRDMTAAAVRAGRDPAEVAYTLATNYGYKIADAQKKPTDAADRIETLKRGQAASKTISNTGSGSADADAPLTISTLEKMDDAEFASLVADPAKWNKLVRQFN